MNGYKLFVPFFQTDEGISRKYGGFGLGLSISNHLIKQMGGEIQVTSEINKGSCFFFTLKFPTQESTPSNTDTLSIENDRKTHKQSTCLATSFGGIQVLLVDDDEINRFIGSKALKKLGIPCSGWQWRKCHPSTTSTSY